MPILERVIVVALLAATLASSLVVARNDLAPVQWPITFGHVLWFWFAAVYVALSLPAAGVLALAGRASRRAWLPRVVLGIAGLGVLGVMLASNPLVAEALFGLQGPARFRYLLPAAAGFAVVGVVAAVVSPAGRERPHRILAGATLVLVLAALAPWRAESGSARSLPAYFAPRFSGQRLLVVGVDGADWRYMEPLMARGELPRFAALRASGAWGPLRTFEPTLSPVIWTTVATGKAPKEHRIRSFTTLRLRGVAEALPRLRSVRRVAFRTIHDLLEWAGQIYTSPVSGDLRRVPAFWNIAAAQGSPVSVLGWWATWPAEPLPGYLVSERVFYYPLRPGEQRPSPDRVTFPPRLYGEIAPLIIHSKAVTLEQIRPFFELTPEQLEEMKAFRLWEGAGIARELPGHIAMFETTRRLALDLIARGRARYGLAPDLLVLFRNVDKACHETLEYSELLKRHPGVSKEKRERYGHVVTAAYREMDRALGQIVDAFGDGTIVVLSDHGFQGYERPDGTMNYNHLTAPDGIFVAAGPLIRPGRVDGLTVFDVLPLLLYLKDFPVAQDLAGQLKEQLLVDGLLARQPIRQIASYGIRSVPVGAAVKDDRDVDQEMLERLRALGYVQ
jgi:hypothetical protein